MMRVGYLLFVVLMLVSCQSATPLQPATSPSMWYEMGLSDAMAGAVVKDNASLVEWSANPDIERTHYLQGYRDGQATLCHSDRLSEWGKSGKDFPASCDGSDHAEQLRQAWQKGADSAR